MRFLVKFSKQLQNLNFIVANFGETGFLLKNWAQKLVVYVIGRLDRKDLF